ncbi:MAG TPA: hypothetical protein VHI13_19035 [Candidatus Kapabacteria bacterium]|nr:hypothetical protein [Candidatus Kapabacteria bacterium]
MGADAGLAESIASAELEAMAQNTTLGRMLMEDAQAMEYAPYPTAECLIPDEVHEFCNGGELPAGRKAHLQACAICQAMIAASKPDAEHVGRFLHEFSALGPILDAKDAKMQERYGTLARAKESLDAENAERGRLLEERNAEIAELQRRLEAAENAAAKALVAESA